MGKSFDRAYLLRCVLKATTGLGRNSSCRSVLMVPTSCRAKSNNIVAGNKPNSDYFSMFKPCAVVEQPRGLGGLRGSRGAISRHSESHGSHRARRLLPPLSKTNMIVENPFLESI